MLQAKAVLLALGLLVFAAVTASSQDEAAKKPFFLPKSPAAAAYVLGRLSNAELIAAPRSEFVYVALLQRPGLDRKYRTEALNGLANIRHTDFLTELLRGIDELDKKGDASEPVLRELAVTLTSQTALLLSGKRAGLQNLADSGQTSLARQLGYAALLTADASPDTVWRRAQDDPAKLADLLSGISLVRDATIRAALYPRVEPVLHKPQPDEVLCAAISALPAIPDHDTETFRTITGFMNTASTRNAAVASLRRLPRASWPHDQAQPLLNNLLKYLAGIPVDQRTTPEAVSAFQLASDLAGLLPADQAKSADKELRALGVSVMVLHTIKEQMLYDKSQLVIEAGKPAQIILINDDSMPHNVAIVAPGSAEEIGQAAEKMPPEPDSEGRLYIPATPKLLHATRMAEPGQQIALGFTAPSEPGDYQYVCTFPGHWRRMIGTLVVAKDVEAYFATNRALPQPVSTPWKIGDFGNELAVSLTGRNLTNGRELFTKLGCAQCHKLGALGASYGPELTDVFHRYANDRTNILRQILEPSLVISNRYINYEFTLADGESVFGMITREEPQKLTIQTGPSESLMQSLDKSDVKSRKASALSVMPAGLLDRLSRDQVLDLLGYLEAGGQVAGGAP